ncbi:MAG: hypothetical protein ABI871_05475 [Chthoniobacterales bacterium]
MNYPFAKAGFVAGVIAGVAGGLLLGTPLAGFAFFVLFVATGLVWRRDEPPVLPFALAFQWLFIVIGYLYIQAGGQIFDLLLGNVDLAIFLALAGLLCVAVGLRFGIGLLGRRLTRHLGLAQSTIPSFDLRALFWVTVITYSVSWVIEISPMEIFFNAAQILYGVVSFREVLFCLLWLTILRQREGYRYGLIAFVVAVIPRFISKQSTFKELIFMVLIVVLTEFRPWVKSDIQRIFHRRLGAALLVLSMLLLLAGGLWEGGIKPIWRNLEIEGSPTEKLETFGRVAEFAVTEMESEGWAQALVSRVSSITQFGLVLDRVPSIVPHENGKLTLRAINHILLPRFLFPGKENLGTDSWLAEEYAGMQIGEDTSVGIGYMAEFYVDWGALGMMPCLLGLGLFLGLVYAIIYLTCPNYAIARALTVVPFVSNFTTFEATLPKLLGGLIMNTAILLIMVRFIPGLLRVRDSRQRTVRHVLAGVR